MKYTSHYIVLVMLLASPAVAGSGDDIRVYARVDAETVISPGDEFAYLVVVEGGGKPSRIGTSALASFKPRPLEGGSSIQVINGQRTISYTQKYALTAGEAGAAVVPPVTVVVNGRTYTTNSVEVPIGKTLTVDVSVSSKRCYAGEPVVLTVRWTAWARVEGGFSVEAPVFQGDDFYFEDVSGDPGVADPGRPSLHGVPVTVAQDRRDMQGVSATMFSFTKVLIPKAAGRIKLDPITVSARVAVGLVETNDIFRRYMLKFERASVASEPIEMEVLPLPEEGKPAEFYGLVGQYTISASATPTQISVGDPITLTIRIGGNPYLKPVQWPPLEQVPELAANFKIPSEKASPVMENGFKVFTQTLRANSDSVAQIPAIPLAYFDSSRGRYVVARTDPIRLEVAPTRILTNADLQGTNLSPAGGAMHISPVQAVRKGLSANYYGPEVLVDQRFSLLSAVIHPGYLGIWLTPLAALGTSLAIRVSGRKSPESVARKRRRQAAATAIRQLKAAGGGTKDDSPLLARALRGYIGDRFGRVSASLTADDCRRVIDEAIGDPTIAERCGDLIASCEAARYAPSNAIGATNASPVLDAVELIRTIEKQLKK